MIQSVSGMGGGMGAMRGAQGPPPPQEAFNKIDTDGDGMLNASELQTMSDMMADKMGTNAPSADDLMAQFDGDGDGVMSFAEFEAGRPQGMQKGGGMGGGQGKMNQMSQMNQMDLSSLFAESDDEAEVESELDLLLAYA